MALDVIMRHGLRLHYVSNGQRVPEDLHLPESGLFIAPGLQGSARRFAPSDRPGAGAGDDDGRCWRLAVGGEPWLILQRSGGAGLRRLFGGAIAGGEFFAGRLRGRGAQTATIANRRCAGAAGTKFFGHRRIVLRRHCRRLRSDRPLRSAPGSAGTRMLGEVLVQRRQVAHSCRPPVPLKTWRSDGSPAAMAYGIRGRAANARRRHFGRCRNRSSPGFFAPRLVSQGNRFRPLRQHVDHRGLYRDQETESCRCLAGHFRIFVEQSAFAPGRPFDFRQYGPGGCPKGIRDSNMSVRSPLDESMRQTASFCRP